jgi:acyl-CoA thioesterase
MTEEYEALAPRFKEALLTKVKDNSPFWWQVDMELVDVKKGWAKMRSPFSPKLANANGFAHGGVFFSLADTAVAMALIGLVDKADFLTTIEMKINYLKPVSKGEIIAEARIIHKGTHTALGDIELKDSDGNLVAKALSTYAIIKKNNAQK